MIKKMDSNAIHNELMMDILLGKLKPGERLKEIHLAKRFDTSRTPVREALFKLQSESLIVSEKYKGFLVKRPSVHEMKDIYPILWTLESLAIESSDTLDSDYFSGLRAINQQFKGMKHDPFQAIELDARWHEMLISRCNNSRLVREVQRIRGDVKRYEYLFMSEVPSIEDSVTCHESIVQSLELGEVERALDRVEENWKSGMKIITERLSERE